VPFDAAPAADRLANQVASCAAPELAELDLGAPPRDLARSPAAACVARLAAAQGLRLYHYEHRHHLPLPEDFVPEHAPELAVAPEWRGGVLPERKYQSFRHDQAIGSFHPGMRGKWTAHELCHALVGFAWRPGATPLFLATASRLAELLPVVLWYFLDEAHLRRCPVHRESGPLYRRLCLACEAAASARVDDLFAHMHLDGGRDFFEREVRAIRRTLVLGEPVPHLYGSLDLCSDGVAYAAAHGPRLSSEAFERFADGFLVECGGWVRSLDALEARALDVLRAIVEGAPLDPLAPSASHGRARWVLQDLGWRLLELWHQTEGEAAEGLLSLVDRLAAEIPATADPSRAGDAVLASACAALGEAAQGYRALHEDWVVPDPDAVFALGYAVPGLGAGSHVGSLVEGVRSALPLTAGLVGADLPARVASFAATDAAVRVPIGRRFATWLLGRASAPLAALGRFEAELAHAAATDPAERLLGLPEDGRWKLATGVVVLRAPVDVVQLAAAVDFGDVEAAADLSVRDVDGAPIPDAPSAVAIARRSDGDADVHPIDLAVAAALMSLGDGGPLDLDPDTIDDLWERQLIRAARWTVEP
jgi:hypothetical protein